MDHDAYLGLIYQVYGLSFFILGLVIWLLPNRRDNRSAMQLPHLPWLAAFALAHGSLEFVAREKLGHNEHWLEQADITLSLVSFTILFEFGRRLWNNQVLSFKLRGVFVYPAVLTAGLWLLIDAPERDATLGLLARCVLGAPGAILAAVAIGITISRAPQETTTTAHRALWVAATALGCYGLLTVFLGVMEPRFPLIPTQADFLAWTGVPVQVFRAITALMLASAFAVIARHQGHQNSQALARIVDTIPGFVFRVKANPEHRTIDILLGNFSLLTGYPREEFLGSANRTLLDLVDSRDRDMVLQAYREDTYTAGYRLRAADGREIWVREKGTRVSDANGIWIEGYVVDETAQKDAELALHQREQQLSQAERVSKLGYWQLDYGVNQMFWSGEVYRIFGVNPEDYDPSLDGGLGLVHPDEVERVTSIFKQAMANDGGKYLAEYRILPTDGRTKYVRATGETEFDSTGEPLLTVGIIQDITEQHEADIRLREYQYHLEEMVEGRTLQLQEARQAAEKASVAKSALLSRLSHELRTPLNAIVGFSHLLASEADTMLSSHQVEALSEIQQAGFDLQTLIDDLLDLEDVVGDKHYVELEPVHLSRVMLDWQRMHMTVFRRLNISATLVGDIDEASKTYVITDQLRLTKVLDQLTSNSQKHTGAGGRISLGYEKRANGLIHLFIEDDGSGISSEQQSAIFDTFSRTDSPYGGVDGMGIGLAIARGMVDLMGGKIGFESREGCGSRFWIELEEASVPGVPLPVATNLDKTKLLYIEDDAQNREVMNELVSGFIEQEFLEAASAHEGLSIAQREQPRLILLDLGLPDMDGYEVKKKLAAMPETSAIPVVAISGSAMPEDFERTSELGFAAHLTKPIRVRELQAVITPYLKSSPALHVAESEISAMEVD